MSPSPVIRPARASDRRLLASIEADADQRFVDVGYAFCREFECLALEDVERALAERLLWVAEVDGVLSGFACGWRLGRAAHLGELAVVRAAGGRGVGRALLQAFEVGARGLALDAVTLTTYRDVSWNAPWYARQGYRPLARDAWTPELAALVAREHALGLDRAPRVLMTKALQP